MDKNLTFGHGNILTTETLTAKQRRRLRGQLRLESKLSANNWHWKFNKDLGEWVSYLVRAEQKFSSKLSQYSIEKRVRRNLKSEVLST